MFVIYLRIFFYLAIWLFKALKNENMQRDTGYKVVENINLSGIGFIGTAVLIYFNDCFCLFIFGKLKAEM